MPHAKAALLPVHLNANPVLCRQPQRFAEAHNDVFATMA
jgi:hypothetical protein